MAEYKNLTHEQQVAIFEQNRGLVYHIKKRYVFPDGYRDDAIQEGMLALWEAVQDLDKYDQDRGSLSTFLGIYIQRRLSSLAYQSNNRSGLAASTRTLREADNDTADLNKRRLFGICCSLDAPVDDTADIVVADTIGTDDEYGIYEDARLEALNDVLNLLVEREQTAVRLYFGIGCEPVSRKEIAARCGVAVTTVDNRINKGLQHLREQESERLLEVFAA